MERTQGYVPDIMPTERTAPMTAITARAAGWTSRLRSVFSMPEGVS